MGNRIRTGVSRREFARRAAIASAAALLPTTASPTTASGPAETPLQAAPASQLAPESQAEAEARYQAILNAYGSRLSDTQKTDLRRMNLEAQPALDRVRAFHLENGDSPALYLKPLVEREKKPAAGASATDDSKKS